MGRIRISLILREEDRSAFTVLPQGCDNFSSLFPNRVCKDLIVLTFHQDISTIILRRSGENGMANVPDALVSEPVHGDKLYKDSRLKHYQCNYLLTIFKILN